MRFSALVTMMMTLSSTRAWISKSINIRAMKKSEITSQSLLTSSIRSASRLSSTKPTSMSADTRLVNLSTASLAELESLMVAWGYPKFRGSQIYHWIRQQGVTDAAQMQNLPKALRAQLVQYTKPSSLHIQAESLSKDGTIKRLYKCYDGQLIESVLMPYDDGRYTACISSQAGCAQGCVFCATGQMGFARQLKADEILEQVSLFASLLKQQDKRLSNVVFMGEGEPLANYREVKEAIGRIINEIGIGARKITVSTVGIVPNIRKLAQDLPQVRLAVSLHCATDEERSALLPANRRYGGLGELMGALKEYQDTLRKRLTLEWALIDGKNDSVETARQLGALILQYQLRRDMVHINVIPLNPTGGYAGSPSQRSRVNAFCQVLEHEFGVACTPRVRRGIDIEAGCGQLKVKELSTKKKVETWNVEDQWLEKEDIDLLDRDESSILQHTSAFVVDEDAVNFDLDEFDDPDLESLDEQVEANRLIALVEGSVIPNKLFQDDRQAPKP